MLREHLGLPLTAIPDPFVRIRATARTTMRGLRAFLDSFGFEYEFLSATGMLQERPIRQRAHDRAREL